MFEESLLEAVRAEADLRVSVDDNLRRLIGIAANAGVSNAELVQATGLSRTAVAEITVAKLAGARGLQPPEIEVVMQFAKNVALVAAGGVGYHEYRSFHAYICQEHRHFAPDIERFGFYADRELKPEFPKILDSERSLTFNADSADRLRQEGRDLLADIVDKVIAVGFRGPHDPHDVYALSAPADEVNTLKLDAPIKHVTTGRGTGFVQKQRYVSEHSLKKNPKTTRDLLNLDS